MGLRDAIAAGKNEIITTAEKIISSLEIDEQIRKAVVKSETHIFVSFPRSTNMHIIQQEVVRQITEEGFEVEWEKTCCSEAKMEHYSGYNWECAKCGHIRPDDGAHGRIRISWDSD